MAACKLTAALISRLGVHGLTRWMKMERGAWITQAAQAVTHRLSGWWVREPRRLPWGRGGGVHRWQRGSGGRLAHSLVRCKHTVSVVASLVVVVVLARSG